MRKTVVSRLQHFDRAARSWPVVSHLAFCRCLVAGVLGLLVGCGMNPVADRVRQLKDSDERIRRQAASDLLAMKDQAKPAVGALCEALRDQDREVRRLACRALGQLAPESLDGLDALRETLGDDELPVRIAAAFAIQELAPTEESHTAVLIEAMKMGEGGVIVAVGGYGPEAAWAVPTLMALLQDQRPGIRRITADALRQIGSAAGAAEGALRQAAQSDEDDRVRDAAQEALAAISRSR